MYTLEYNFGITFLVVGFMIFMFVIVVCVCCVEVSSKKPQNMTYVNNEEEEEPNNTTTAVSTVPQVTYLNTQNVPYYLYYPQTGSVVPITSGNQVAPVAQTAPVSPAAPIAQTAPVVPLTLSTTIDIENQK